MTNSPALFGDPGSDLGVNEEWCQHPEIPPDIFSDGDNFPKQ